MTEIAKIALTAPECANRKAGVCEAYRTLADNHRLAREQAISALMAIRKIAADRKSIGNSDEWPGENLESALALLSAVDQECFEWLTQWGVATNAEV